jgi:hypothetical protein
MGKITALFLFVFISACSHNVKVTTLSERGKYIKDPKARDGYMDIRAAGKDVTTKEKYEKMAALAKRYPDEVLIVASHAALLGDYGMTLSADMEAKHQAEAVRILEPWTKKTYSDPIGFDRLVVFNEYYFHSRQYKKQYELGKEFTSLKGDGAFSTGVGGSMYALELLKNKQPIEAKEIALDAQKAWESRTDMTNPEQVKGLYSNIFYVLAMAIAGDRERAKKLYNQHVLTDSHSKEYTRWLSTRNPFVLP